MLGMARIGVGPTGSAARYWAGREIASRWWALVVLGLIAGMAGGTVVAAVAGARRTSVAYERFQAHTAAPDAIVFGTQVGAFDADYGPVKDLPEVVDAGEFALASLALKGYPKLGALAPGDRRLYRTLARPLLSAGRLPDPHRVDEIVVNRLAASRFGLQVGDRVTIISSNSLLAFFGQGPMRGGPTIPARVVGVGNGSMDLIFGPDAPGFLPSGAVLTRYGTKAIEGPRAGSRRHPTSSFAYDPAQASRGSTATSHGSCDSAITRAVPSWGPTFRSETSSRTTSESCMPPTSNRSACFSSRQPPRSRA